MEAAVFALVFVLLLVANVAAARTGYAEDTLWSRQRTLIFYGVRLGLPDGDRAEERPVRFAPPRAAERPRAVVAPPDPERRGLQTWPQSARGA